MYTSYMYMVFCKYKLGAIPIGVKKFKGHVTNLGGELSTQAEKYQMLEEIYKRLKESNQMIS